MENLKTRIQKKMAERGADLNNFTFKFHKESPYQKKRFKAEFVQPECWIYPKGKKEGYLITEEDFNVTAYSEPFIEMILDDNRSIC
jgi:hypothetical protein